MASDYTSKAGEDFSVTITLPIKDDNARILDINNQVNYNQGALPSFDGLGYYPQIPQVQFSIPMIFTEEPVGTDPLIEDTTAAIGTDVNILGSEHQDIVIDDKQFSAFFTAARLSTRDLNDQGLKALVFEPQFTYQGQRA